MLYPPGSEAYSFRSYSSFNHYTNNLQYIAQRQPSPHNWLLKAIPPPRSIFCTRLNIRARLEHNSENKNKWKPVISVHRCLVLYILTFFPHKTPNGWISHTHTATSIIGLLWQDHFCGIWDNILTNHIIKGNWWIWCEPLYFQTENTGNWIVNIQCTLGILSQSNDISLRDSYNLKAIGLHSILNAA